MSIESVMPSSHLILCRPLLLLPPVPPSIRVFSNESTLRMSGYHIGQHWMSESKWVVDFKGTTLLSDPNQTTNLAYIFSVWYTLEELARRHGYIF